MRKLLLLLLLMTLPNCAGTRYVPVNPKPCLVLKIKDPPLGNPEACGDKVCYSIPDDTAMTRWIHDVIETRNDLRGCLLVQPVDK
jgi:hypothetical protein